MTMNIDVVAYAMFFLPVSHLPVRCTQTGWQESAW